IIFSFGILIFLIGIISAVNVNIDMKNSFGIGEEVLFNYTLISDTSLTGQYIIRVLCPSAPLPLLEIKNFTLQANQPLTENYIYLSKIFDNMNSQTCNATVLVFNSVNLSKSKSFRIVNNPPFNINILTCKEQACRNQTRVFIKGRDIYLDYQSDTPNPLITANLTYPNGDVKEITLPTSIKAEQIGTYTLYAQALKENYQTINKKVQFGVIEKEANIGYTNLAEEKQKLSNPISNYIFIIGGIVLILASILLVIYFIKRKKK
ncbi:MAG: hypothetical protein AABX99_04215, partial [Nanoarchaeota archaeon]